MSALHARSVLASLLAAIILVLLSLHLWHALNRPLWIDETMAMVNYPLPDVAAMFNPLPYYSQAAPPFFNAFTSLIAGLEPFYGRLVTLAVILPAVLATVFWAYRSVLVCAVALGGFLLIAISIPAATEFKYYGFEILSISIAMAWMLRKDPKSPLGVLDIAILTLSLSMGISSIIFTPIALMTILFIKFSTKSRITAREVALIGLFAALVGIYYLVIRHASSIQMGTYYEVYQLRGLGVVIKLARHFVRVAGWASLPVLLVGALLTLISYKDPASKKLIAYAGLVGLAVITLAFLGFFPAVYTRHITFMAGIYLFILCNGAFVFLRTEGPYLLARRRMLAAVASVATLIALVGSARLLLNPNLYVNAANDKAVFALLAQREHVVGLWVGAQPVIEYYRRLYPELDRREYFGRVNVESTALWPKIRSGSCTKETYASLSSEIEASKDQGGYWGRGQYYTACSDYSAPAETFASQAPKGAPFLIFASHPNVGPLKEPQKPRLAALFDALDKRNCAGDVVASGKKYFILRATCP